MSGVGVAVSGAGVNVGPLITAVGESELPDFDVAVGSGFEVAVGFGSTIVADGKISTVGAIEGSGIGEAVSLFELHAAAVRKNIPTIRYSKEHFRGNFSKFLFN